MKSKINFIGLAVVLVGTVLLLKLLDGTLCFYWAIPTITLSGFNIFQQSVADGKYAKYIYSHPLNFTASKSVETLYFEIGVDLLYDKIIEEIRKAKIKISYVSRDDGLAAISIPMSLRSWGERVDFEIVEKENRTELIIQSFAPGAVISWGKNSENTKRLIKHIEGSFTI